ncbi:MAG: GIN domain-containing protein, partial [Myxococcota bacterium]
AKGLELDALTLDASGGVELHLAGRVKKAKVDVSGGVSMKAAKLEVGDLSVDASGGCEVDVGVKDTLVGDASGGVGITVHGRPAKTKMHTSAGADVSYVD